jgi:hypothetical protein
MRLAPTPRQGQNFGEAIREQTQRIVDNALSGARREIEEKLDQLRAERAGLQEAASNMRGPGRLALQSRIDRLDRDIVQLEEGLAKLGRTVTTEVRTPEPRVFAETRPAQGFGGAGFPPDNFDPTPIVATSLGILFIAFPLTLAIVRFIWKRSTSAPTPAITAEQQRRFDRLEQSVDAIAIEVERISENQRYLTKLLAEPKQTSKIGT